MKYDRSYVLQCPECLENIHLGYAGPKGMQQHQGSKKCRASITKMEKEKKNQKIRTLFEVGLCKSANSTTQQASPQQPILNNIGPLSKPAILVSNGEGLTVSEATSTRKGCVAAWTLLDTLSKRVQELEENDKLPIGDIGDELAAFNKASAEAACAGVSDEAVWEAINPQLDRLLGFGKSTEEVLLLLRRGEKGLQGLLGFLEYVVGEKGVAGSLLEGKINLLVETIDK